MEHVRDQELSGLSVAGYCRRHDLRPATFYGWRRLRRECAPGRIAAAVGFTEVFQVEAPPFPPASGAARVADVPVALGASWAAEVALVPPENSYALVSLGLQ